MKKIQLIKITMAGFKIYKDETTVDFTNETILVGGNGKGKSSIADAISWVVTGKVYDGKKKIEDGILNIDSKKAMVELEYTNELGEIKKIKRTYTKASGTTLFVDGIKTSQQILSKEINPDVFLLNFNPCSFLGKKPIEARNLIIEMTGVSITADEVFNNLSKSTQNDILKLTTDISNLDKVNKDSKKELSLKESNHRKAIILMDSNLDKIASIVIPEKNEFKNLEKIEELEKEIEDMTDNNPHISDYENKLKEKDIINGKISDINGKSFDTSKLITLNKELNDLNLELNNAKSLEFKGGSHESISKEIISLDREAGVLESENNLLRKTLTKINNKYTYKEGSNCPCCKQKITATVVKTMEALKKEESKDIVDQGVSNKNKLLALKLKIDELTKSVSDLQEANDKLEKDFYLNKKNQIANIEKSIKEKEKEILNEVKSQKAFEKSKKDEIAPLKEELKKLELKEIKEKITNHSKEIKNKKLELKSLKQINSDIKAQYREIDQLIKSISLYEKENKAYEKSIKKLKKEILLLNKGLIAIKLFNEEKIRMTEELMSKNLSRTSFKIEEISADGEIKPCFKIIFDGKLIEQCSLSEQMKAGMEIVEMVKDTFDIDYPMFLDNSESITEVKTAINQIIRTVVVDVNEVVTIDNTTLNNITEKSREIVETFFA